MEILISSSVGIVLYLVKYEGTRDVETEVPIGEVPIHAKDASASVLALVFWVVDGDTATDALRW